MISNTSHIYSLQQEPEWAQRLFPFLALHTVSSDPARPSVTFSFTVQPQHCNRLNNLRMYYILPIPPQYSRTQLILRLYI
jgi:hypothetical protein